MAHGTNDMTDKQAATSHSEFALKPTLAELLIEQYKLFEDRRQYFGSQFMQTIGGVSLIFSILIGLVGGKSENSILLAFTLVIGGGAFSLLAFLAHRLGQRQDDCERVMSSIELDLQSIGYTTVSKMPTGAQKMGARKLITLYLLGIAVAMWVAGIYLLIRQMWPGSPRFAP